MKDRASKIFGLLFFLILCGGLIYLTVTGSEINGENNYSGIKINGNKLLSEIEYLSYVGLNDTASYSQLSLEDVKSKLAKHPYVVRSEVHFDGINMIEAELLEKRPKAFVSSKNNFNLITEDGELLPVLNKNLLVGLPIISNINKNVNDPIKPEGLKPVFKIIDAIKIADKNMYESLSEINLRNGRDILIMFAGLSFPIVFGKNNESRKILALKDLWYSLLSEQQSRIDIEYIDLRYKNKIFIRKRNSTEIAG